MTGNCRLFASERPRNEREKPESKRGEYRACDDDVFPHFQSLFQLPCFQISRAAIRAPITTSNIAIDIPITHSIGFPIPESKTSDCRARELP